MNKDSTNLNIMILLFIFLYEFIYYKVKVSDSELLEKEIENKTLILFYVYLITLVAFIGFSKFDINQDVIFIAEVIFFIMGLMDISLVH